MLNSSFVTQFSGLSFNKNMYLHVAYFSLYIAVIYLYVPVIYSALQYMYYSLNVIEKRSAESQRCTVFSGLYDATFLFLKPLLKAGATHAPVRPFYGFQLGRGQLEKI